MPGRRILPHYHSCEPPVVNPCRAVRDDFQLLRLLANLPAAKCGARCQLISDHRRVELGPFRPPPPFFFRPFQLRLAPPSKAIGGADRGSNKAEINLICLAIATREAQDAAACSGSSCDCDNVVLGVGDPRTSGYRLLSGGRADGLPTTSQLVSARLGIDAALSLRHLYLWIFLLSSGLLRLSGSLSISASVNSYRTAGPSPAISASWVVVVIKVSSLPLSESFRCRPEQSP